MTLRGTSLATRVQRSKLASLSQPGRRATLEITLSFWASQRKLLLPMQALSLRLTCSPGLRFCTAVFEVRAADRGERAQPGLGRTCEDPGTTTGPQLRLRGCPPIGNSPPARSRAHAARDAPRPSQRWITAQRRVQEPGLRLPSQSRSRNGGKFPASSMSL